MDCYAVHSVYIHHIVQHLLCDDPGSLQIVKIAIRSVVIKRNRHGHLTVRICAKCFSVEEVSKSSKYLSDQYSKSGCIRHEYKADFSHLAEYYRRDDSCDDSTIYGKSTASDIQHGFDSGSHITLHYILVKSEQDIVESCSKYGRDDKYKYEIQIHFRILFCSLCLVGDKYICQQESYHDDDPVEPHLKASYIDVVTYISEGYPKIRKEYASKIF